MKGRMERISEVSMAFYSVIDNPLISRVYQIFFHKISSLLSDLLLEFLLRFEHFTMHC